MKHSRFNTIIKEGKNLLMYNSLSGSLLSIPENRLKEYEDILYKEGFLIDDDKDELLTYKYMYYKTLFDYNKLEIIIAPTTNCNLCCPYCFEAENKHKEYMDQKVIDAIIKYISSKKDKNIHITWFGGEPLLCFDKIVDINERLVNDDVQFHASMITNGTLFSHNIIDKLPSLKLDSIQITLDGEKEHHNQIRFFNSKRGTFDLILSNVLNILEKTSVRVILKINIDKNNMHSYLDLVGLLTDKYNKYITTRRLGIQHNSVKNRTDFGGCTECLSEDEYFKFKTQVLHENIPIPQLHLACPLRSRGTIIIGPDGNIYKCLEHIGNKPKSIGNIKSHSISISKMAKLALDNDPFDDIECSNCAILPICGGGCPIDRSKKTSRKDSSVCLFLKTNLPTIIKNAYYNNIKR